MAAVDDLYRDILLDHHKNPRRYGRIEHPDVTVEGANPLCGDEMVLTMNVSDGRIRELRLESHGCSISRASGSMMAEAIEGRTLAQAKELVSAFKSMMMGKASAEDLPPELEDLAALEGVRSFPVRVKCALLAWNTLLEGLEAAEGAGRNGHH